MKMSGSDWDGWGVSQIGPLHLKEGLPNQDAYVVQKYKWGIVGVVCDGLGSKQHSDIGSKALTKAIIQASKVFDFDKKDITLFEPLVKALWDINIYPYSEDEASTTLLFAIVKNSKVYIGRVGDGVIAVFGNNNLLIEEDKSGFTNYTTPFGRDLKIEWCIYELDEVSSIVMSTDGISEDIQKDKILNFFSEYILNYQDVAQRKRKKEIKKWLKNWPVRGHSDDKTIVALIRGKDG